MALSARLQRRTRPLVTPSGNVAHQLWYRQDAPRGYVMIGERLTPIDDDEAQRMLHYHLHPIPTKEIS